MTDELDKESHHDEFNFEELRSVKVVYKPFNKTIIENFLEPAKHTDKWLEGLRQAIFNKVIVSRGPNLRTSFLGRIHINFIRKLKV